MATAFPINNSEAKHQASMSASLNRRLLVALATNNLYLVELLEREKTQVEAQAVNLPPIARLKNLWQQFVEWLAHADDLQIWQTTDGVGVIWWHVFNPQTGKEICTDSETEMRAWIEQNYWEA